MTTDPYRPPAVAVTDIKDPGGASGFAAPGRVVAAGRGAGWIGEGWDLFKAAPLLWVVATLLQFGIQAALGTVPLLGSIAGLLLAPVLMAGSLAFAHGIAGGGDADFALLFAGFRDRLGPLLMVGVINLALMAGVVSVALIGMVVVVGSSLLGNPSAALHASLLAGSGFGLVLLLLVAVALLMLLSAAYWYAPGLVFLAGMEAAAAMKESFATCMRNWRPFLVYGLLAVVAVMAGALFFGVGLLVAMPVLTGAYYAGFRDIFGRSASD